MAEEVYEGEQAVWRALKALGIQRPQVERTIKII